MATVLTAEGHRAPPSWFVKRLEAFDPNLRVVWGFGQAVPFAGWVIERRVPDHMKAKVYGDPRKDVNRQRYADQGIVDEHGDVVARRQFDMMPDWHAVYRVMNEDGKPILELGDYVIDYLRRNYERTLLGHPELGLRHHAEDLAEKTARDEKQRQQTIDEAARMVMENKTRIFADVYAFGGQPKHLKEGTELHGDTHGNNQGTDPASPKSEGTC